MRDNISELALSPDEWFGRIALIAQRIAADSIDVEAGLRHAFHLLQIAPGPLREMLAIEIEEDQFEAWLAEEAFDQAAQALVADHFPMTLAVPDGHATVTIKAPWFDASGEACAQMPAKSVLQAWLACLVDLQKRAATEFFVNPDPALREPRSAPHRRSTRH